MCLLRTFAWRKTLMNGRLHTSNFQGALLTLAGCVAVLLYFYSPVVFHPNDYLFSIHGDGVKNYFSVVSYVSRQDWSWNLEGMNAPFGESIFYTDGQPFLAWILKGLVGIAPGTELYLVGILNTLMLLSMLAGPLLSYRILRNLGTSTVLSVTTAMGIMMMQPQLFRLEGHYALSYCWAIPLVIWLMLQMFRSEIRPWKWALVAGLVNMILFLLHAYLGAVAVAFQLVFWLLSVRQTANNGTGRIRKAGVWGLSSVLVPLIAFPTIIALADQHSNRPNDPYGYFEYYADFDTVLLPHHAPLRTLVDLFLPEFTQTWEGWCYLGMGLMLGAGILLFWAWKSGIRQIPGRLKRASGDEYVMRNMMIAAVVLLFVSFALPFRWGMQSALDYFPWLKQFRAIGRFSWPFFYAFALCIPWLLSTFIEQSRHKAKWVTALPYVIFAMMIVEGYAPHRQVSEHITRATNAFDPHQMSETWKEVCSDIDPSRYAATFSIPYFYIGTEDLFDKKATDKTYYTAMILSYQLKLPLMNAYLTRTSIDEAGSMWKMMYSGIVDESIQGMLQKPLLVLRTPGELDSNEALFLSRCTSIYTSTELELYEFWLDPDHNP
ncbi:MAG: hypothetical protein KDC12_08860 [Flavobacteriales bacterium]|nr:hypothetical protein [Flavobacteriales bacterium]